MFAWLVATGVVASLATGNNSIASTPGNWQADESVKKPFTHTLHVPGVWEDPDVPEQLRDCRGCHNYSLVGSHDPQSVCTKCHFSNDKNQYAFELEAEDTSFLTGLTALRTPGALFQHSNHLVLECRECHDLEAEAIAAPKLMPKQGGMAVCLDCHGGATPRQSQLRFMSAWRDGKPVTDEYRAKAIEKLQRGLVESLNGSSEMGANQGDTQNVEPFRHSDHILPAFLGAETSLTKLKETVGRVANGVVDQAREADCAACHGPMMDAAPAFGAAASAGSSADPHVAFDTSAASCGACHIADAARNPIQFKLVPEVRTSRTAGTFSHEAHLGWTQGGASGSVNATIEGREAIEANGCLACHEHDGSSEEGYVLRDDLADPSSFKGCQSCHEPSAWAPEVHGDWWTHENHGDWTNCSSCHEFGGSDFASQRLQAEVTRRSASLFRVETQSHPHITTKEGESVAESCARCHRQPVKELPSRILEATFQHASHLPSEPTAADCAECHGTSVNGAEHSADIGSKFLASTGDLQPLSEDHDGLTYDPAACATCHLGTPPVPLEAPAVAYEPLSRTVPEFSHAAHLGSTLAGGKPVGCTDCHVATGEATGSGDLPVAANATGFGTLEAAMNCTLCHDHSSKTDPLRARLTGGGVTEAEVKACTLCHVGGIPAEDAQISFSTARVSDILGGASQFHPNQEECSTCHIPREGIIAAPVAPTDSRVFASRLFYKPEESAKAKPAIHRGDTRKLKEGFVTCFACHWTNTLVDASDGGTAVPPPERRDIRATYGNQLSGLYQFPGGQDAHFESEE